MFFAACSYLPGNYICWRRLREELQSRFIALSLRSFVFENSIVSEVGWDLGLALKGLSLGNGINKGHVLAPQNTCDVATC